MVTSIRIVSRQLAVATIFVTLASVGCFELPAPSNNGQSVVKNLVQTSAQSAAHNVLSPFFNMQDAVARAFFQTAQIQLEYHDLHANNLPAPSMGPYAPDWPPIAGNTAYYANYANMYHDATNYPWAIFYVTHLYTNSPASCTTQMAAGVTVPYPAPNVPEPNKTRRWSFIYVTDVQSRLYNCVSPTPNSTQMENGMTHVVAHELGHQRAGLTDNVSQYAAYHGGYVGDNREDVMANMGAAELTGYSQPVFDGTSVDSPGSHGTCKGNLLSNRLVQ